MPNLPARDRELLIATFWDALDADPAAPHPTGLDPATVTHVRRLHALAHAQLPAGVQTRVQRTIDAESASWRTRLNGKGAHMSPTATAPYGDSLDPVTLPVPARSRTALPARSRHATPWLQPALALAALLSVITLALILYYRASNQAAPAPTPQPIPTAAPASVSGWTLYGGDPARDRNATGSGIATIPAIRWAYPPRGVANAGLMVDRGASADDVLYLASPTGTLAAVDALTGREIWRVQGVGNVVTIDGDGLIAQGGLPAAPAVAPVDLVRLNRLDGSVVWRAEVGMIDPSWNAVVAGGVGYIPSGTDFVAFDPRAGTTIWRTPLDAPASRGASVVDDVIAFGEQDGSVVALSTAGGTQRWRFGTDAKVIGHVTIADGVVYAPASGGAEEALYAIDAETGALRWRFVAPDGARPRAVAASAETVFVPTVGAKLYALDAATGAVRWSFDTGATNVDSVALAGGIVHFATDFGVVFGLNAETGAERWRLQLPAASNSAAMVVDGTYFVSTDGGSVYALAAPAAWVRDLTGDETRTLSGPGQMAFDPAGRLWVTSAKSSSFFIFDQDGNLLETWGEPGSGPGQFAFSDGQSNDLGNILFAPDGGFYVADFMNARVQQFDHDRQFLRSWGTRGMADGEFQGPLGLAFDSAGNLLVSDLFRNDVQRFTPDGQYLDKFGAPGAGPGQFAYAGPITRMPDGTLWITDVGNRRFNVFADDGTFLRSVELHGADPALAFQVPAQALPLRDGVLLVADQAANKVYLIDEQGTWLGEWGELGSGPGQFNNPGCLAITAGGDVFVLDWRNNRIQKFTVSVDAPAGTPES